MYCERCAPEVQTLRPLSTQPLLASVALLRVAAKSEPESGSLMPMQNDSSPRAIAGTIRLASSGRAKRISSGPL